MTDRRIYVLALGFGIGLMLCGALWAWLQPDRQRPALPAAAPAPSAAPAPDQARPALVAVAPEGQAGAAPAPLYLLYVQPGETAAEVVAQLVDAGLLRDGTALVSRLNDLGFSTRIQTGPLRLTAGLSEEELAKLLVAAHQ